MIIRYGKRTLVDTNRLRGQLARSFRSQKPRSLKDSDSEISRGNLPAGGRSSDEILYDNFSSRLTGYLNYWNVLQPEIPWEIQKYLTLITMTNPDLSQAVKNTVHLGNTGHKVIVDAKNSEKVIDKLNSLAYQLYPISAGVDGLVNHYFEQGQRTGAISSEDVISPDFSGVKKVVIVPPYSIRFRYLDGEYKKYQQSGQLGELDLVELNEYTYTYYALQVWENKPYAVPPFLPALKPILTQDEFFKNIQAMSKKFGLLGLNVVVVKRLPRKPGESDIKYRERNQKHIDEVAESVKLNYSQGVLVLPEDQTLTNHSFTHDARGVKELVDMIEEQVFSGVGSHPAMHGRPNSTTESYARIIYGLMLNSIDNLRRLIKRRLEKTYRLDLILSGIPFDFVSIDFNSDKRLQPNVEAMAERLGLDIVLKKVKAGLIDPETAAQELGYSSWADEKLLYDQIKKENTTTKEFMFDRGSQQYKLVRTPLVELKKDDKYESEDNQKAAVKAERKLQEWVGKYLQEVLPYFDQLQPDALKWADEYMSDEENYEKVKKDNGLFISALKDFLEQHPQYLDIPVHDEFKRTVETRIIAAAKYYRESDLAVFGGKPPDVVFKFGVGDQKAADLLTQVGHFYFSKFISNQDFGSEIREFVTEWFKRGEALYGGWTDDAAIEFISRFGYALEGDLNFQMSRIVNSSMGLIQVNSRFLQLDEVGFEYATWIEFPGCCEICEPFNGVEIPVAKVVKRIKKEFIGAKSLDDALAYYKKINRSKEDHDKSIEEIIDKKSWGKCHPNCRGTIRGKPKED